MFKSNFFKGIKVDHRMCRFIAPSRDSGLFYSVLFLGTLSCTMWNAEVWPWVRKSTFRCSSVSLSSSEVVCVDTFSSQRGCSTAACSRFSETQLGSFVFRAQRKFWLNNFPALIFLPGLSGRSGQQYFYGTMNGTRRVYAKALQQLEWNGTLLGFFWRFFSPLTDECRGLTQESCDISPVLTDAMEALQDRPVLYK